MVLDLLELYTKCYKLKYFHIFILPNKILLKLIFVPLYDENNTTHDF